LFAKEAARGEAGRNGGLGFSPVGSRWRGISPILEEKRGPRSFHIPRKKKMATAPPKKLRRSLSGVSRGVSAVPTWERRANTLPPGRNKRRGAFLWKKHHPPPPQNTPPPPPPHRLPTNLHPPHHTTLPSWRRGKYTSFSRRSKGYNSSSLEKRRGPSKKWQYPYFLV